MKALLDKGAEVNARNDSGGTALMIAAKRGHAKVVEHLLKSNGNPNIRLYHFDVRALHTVAQEGFIEIAEYLLTHGAEINCTTQAGETPLISAAYHGKIEMVLLLLKRGADPRVTDSSGNSASDWAYKRGHTDLASALAIGVGVPSAKLHVSSQAIDYHDPFTMSEDERIAAMRIFREKKIKVHASERAVGALDAARTIIAKAELFGAIQLRPSPMITDQDIFVSIHPGILLPYQCWIGPGESNAGEPPKISIVFESDHHSLTAKVLMAMARYLLQEESGHPLRVLTSEELSYLSRQGQY